MKFRDRFEAGQRLARILKPRNLREAVVLSLPRGGVKVGFEIAQALSLPHDIVSIRKIGHPGNPEFAACAIDEVGVFICDESSGVSTESDWFKAESQRQREEAHRRSVLYRQGRAALDIKDKMVILVDDGIATGLTMRLAARNVHAMQPRFLIVAAPVSSEEAARALREESDELILLDKPEEFLGSVGAHYEEFEQVDDTTVIALLEASHIATTVV